MILNDFFCGTSNQNRFNKPKRKLKGIIIDFLQQDKTKTLSLILITHTSIEDNY